MAKGVQANRSEVNKCLRLLLLLAVGSGHWLALFTRGGPAGPKAGRRAVVGRSLPNIIIISYIDVLMYTVLPLL